MAGYILRKVSHSDQQHFCNQYLMRLGDCKASAKSLVASAPCPFAFLHHLHHPTQIHVPDPESIKICMEGLGNYKDPGEKRHTERKL